MTDQQDRSEATARAYRTDFGIFRSWCHGRRRSPLPADPLTVVAFLEDQAGAGLSRATLARRVSAIRWAHLEAGHLTPTEHPEIRTALQEAAEARLAPERRPADPILPADLARMVEAIPDDVIGLRDRALLLVGFAAALRRAELAALRIEDVRWPTGGLLIRVGAEREVPVVRGATLCPVAALRAWVDHLGSDEGPLWPRFARGGRPLPRGISSQEVWRRVKRYAEAAGFPPAKVHRLGAHSLRAGFVTAALRNGADVFRVMEVTGHVSPDTVRGYLRDGASFEEHPGEGLL